MYDVKHAPRLIARNTVIQIIGRVVFLALSLVNFKLIALYLGPSLFGDWGNVFNYTALFTVLADFGLFTVAVREIAKAPKKRQVIMENMLTLRLTLAIAASLIAIVVAFLLKTYAPSTGYAHLLPAISIGIISMLIYFISNIFDVVFHVEMKMYFVAIVELIGKVVAVSLTACAVFWHWGFLWIVMTVAVGNLAGMIARIMYSRRFFTVRLGFDLKMWSWLLKMAIPLGVVFALNNLYFKVDSIMLYMIKGSYDTGIYTAAYRVLETTVFASAFFVQALTPYLSSYLAEAKSRDNAIKIIKHGTEILYAMGGILALAIIFYAKPVVLLLSGPQYESAAIPLVMIAIAATFLYINSLFGQVLVLLDRRRMLLIISTLTLVFNIALNWVLIPHFSFVGAAAATLLSEGILLAGNYLIMRANGLLEIDKKAMGWITLSLILAGTVFSFAHTWPIPWVITFFAVPICFFLLLWKKRVIPLDIIFRANG